ncbi:MAG: hypothetical protein ACYC96_16295, partial [Fimbriimonadaceae bacterium]
PMAVSAFMATGVRFGGHLCPLCAPLLSVFAATRVRFPEDSAIVGLKNEKGAPEDMVGTHSSDGRAIVMGRGSGFKLIKQR